MAGGRPRRRRVLADAREPARRPDGLRRPGSTARLVVGRPEVAGGRERRRLAVARVPLGLSPRSEAPGRPGQGILPEGEERRRSPPAARRPWLQLGAETGASPRDDEDGDDEDEVLRPRRTPSLAVRISRRRIAVVLAVTTTTPQDPSASHPRTIVAKPVPRKTTAFFVLGARGRASFRSKARLPPMRCRRFRVVESSPELAHIFHAFNGFRFDEVGRNAFSFSRYPDRRTNPLPCCGSIGDFRRARILLRRAVAQTAKPRAIGCSSSLRSAPRERDPRRRRFRSDRFGIPEEPPPRKPRSVP
mmetsp:Transcript_26212/g.61599  ORF Transcript_26212/g.61599 Transcript_26212/m.61599 type:complete len:303 (-) Transcript_26212:331-1239(-)